MHEARFWRVAVATLGLGGFLLGVAGAAYESLHGASIIEELQAYAKPRNVAYILREGSICQLAGCGAGAIGGLGFGLLSLARRRARRRLAAVAREDPGALSDEGPP